MRTVLLISMLIALLVVAYLTVKDVTSHFSGEGEKATITAVEKARQVGRKVDQAGRDLEKRLNRIIGE